MLTCVRLQNLRPIGFIAHDLGGIIVKEASRSVLEISFKGALENGIF
jgi:hypothetical protein